MKKMLTGNLNAEIFGYPGKERNFLRAQLARIQHTTNIVPKGIFEMDEETNAMKYAEEQPELTTDTLKSLENWCSLNPIILKVGRCTHTEPLHIPEEEREAYKEKLAEEDKTEEILKAINEQTPIGKDPAWSVQTKGDTQAYNKPGGEGTVSYAINVIKSNRWPGAITIAKNGQYCSIYVGDAIKRGDALFNPTEPPEVQSDPQEQEAQPEPQGKEFDPNAVKDPAEGEEEDA